MKQISIWMIGLFAVLQSSFTVDMQDALQALRPGAEWGLRSESYEGLEWYDKHQTKPTKDEVLAKIEEMKANGTSRDALKKQAKLDVKDQTKSTKDRLDALILILGLDK